MHRLDARVIVEVGRDLHRVFRMRAHAPRQCAHSAQDQPAIEWRRHRAAGNLRRAQRWKNSLSSFATMIPPMTSQWPPKYFVVECMTKSAPSVERPLNDRRPGVVADANRAAFVHDFVHGRDDRRSSKADWTAFPPRPVLFSAAALFYRVEVRHVDECGFQAPAQKQLPQQLVVP